MLGGRGGCVDATGAPQSPKGGGFPSPADNEVVLVVVLVVVVRDDVDTDATNAVGAGFGTKAATLGHSRTTNNCRSRAKQREECRAIATFVVAR